VRSCKRQTEGGFALKSILRDSESDVHKGIQVEDKLQVTSTYSVVSLVESSRQLPNTFQQTHHQLLLKPSIPNSNKFNLNSTKHSHQLAIQLPLSCIKLPSPFLIDNSSYLSSQTNKNLIKLKHSKQQTFSFV
jgi:hypothetical protein